jgi:hypothetical protein
MTDILHETKPKTGSRPVIKLHGCINLAGNIRIFGNTGRVFDMPGICHHIYVKTNTFPNLMTLMTRAHILTPTVRFLAQATYLIQVAK